MSLVSECLEKIEALNPKQIVGRPGEDAAVLELARQYQERPL